MRALARTVSKVLLVRDQAASRRRGIWPMCEEDSERNRPHVDREIDWFFRNSSPNPDRIGCPSENTLRELAQRLRPIDDPGYQHLAGCSPCYDRFRQYQASPVRKTVRRRVGAFLTIAAGVAAIVATVYWWSDQGSKPGGVSPTDVAVVDLRQFLVTRGTQIPSSSPIMLSRADARTEILLPIGFETGPYDLRLVNSSLATVLSIRADAALKNKVVTIHTSMALSALRAGQYQLALRREGEDWHFFPTSLE